MLEGIISKSYQAIKALTTRQVRIECDRIPYHFDNVPLRKLLNWLAVETSISFKPEHSWGWPTHIMIEPTTHCNLRCTLCPVTMGMGRPSGNMDFNLFKKIIDETGDYLFLILTIADAFFFNKEKSERLWSPTGKVRGTSIKYPPTPLGAEARFGAQAPRLRRVIRLQRNPPKQQYFNS